MLEILNIKNGKIDIINEPVKDCWINAICPTSEEIEKIRSFIDVPEETLLSLQDMDEIPVIEREENFLFIIIKTPKKHAGSGLEYCTLPLGIIISDFLTLTICFQENDVIHRLKQSKTNKRPFVLKLLMCSARTYLDYLKEISKKMNLLQKTLEASQKNKDIMNLLELEKSLVYFRTSLNLNNILLEKFSKSPMFIKSKKDKDLMDDVIDENKQAIQMSNIYSSIITDICEAFSSIIANNLNKVMKLLTSIAIILSLPIIIASIYGMNIGLPLQNSPHAFAIIIAISLFLSVISAVIFWRYKLF